MKKRFIHEMNVLIVEDERHMRKVLRDVVLALGFKNVVEANDGAAALKELEYCLADLVLSDMKMEPMDGLEFVKRLRSNPNNPYRFVPVIMITAYANPDTLVDARDAGVSEVMAKPLSADALIKHIRRVFKYPRRFVEAPDFFGPDRRRNKKDAFEGENRRKTPPTFLEQPKLA